MENDMPEMPNMSPSDMNMNNSTTSMKDMAVMHMSFYWGRESTILFPGWPGYKLSMYVLALLFVFFLALVVEVLSISSSKRLKNNPGIGGLVQAIIYAIRMALAYMVMLAVMSFNLGIFIVAVAGHGVGYFLVKFRQQQQQLLLTKAEEPVGNVLPK